MEKEEKLIFEEGPADNSTYFDGELAVKESKDVHGIGTNVIKEMSLNG